MNLEIKIGESKMNPQEQIQKGLEVEKACHPWANDDVLHRIVMDEIKADPNAYMNGNDDDSYQEQEEGEDMPSPAPADATGVANDGNPFSKYE